MREADDKLERLLRAARGGEEPRSNAPFGFDTRVVARWRERRNSAPELLRLVRRVALVAAIVTALASSAAYWELARDEEAAEPDGNVYAIADTAIEAGVFQ